MTVTGGAWLQDPGFFSVAHSLLPPAHLACRVCSLQNTSCYLNLGPFDFFFPFKLES